MTGVTPTTKQASAIAAQVAVYDLPETPCRGLDSYIVRNARAEWGEEFDDDAVAVHFHYIPEDGCVNGLEVTVFDREGKVITSQDFG